MRQFHLTPEASADANPVDAAEILEGLNAMQQEAASATDGPVLIIAGPGSGKTRTLTHRIAYLLGAGKARPFEILALTFTNKAAREMRDRIKKLVGEEAARGMWMGTFHSIFARMLRIEGKKIGYTPDFSIYDTDDTQRVLRDLMDRYHVDGKQFNVRAMRSIISSAKNQMVSPGEYEKMVASPVQEKAALLYRPYQQSLLKANAMDFDDLLLKPIELFEKDTQTLKKYQQRWRYVHIDEYQDTNHAQFLVARMLAAVHRNICVVGDDAQSIYAFRGADIGNILSFQRDYPNATTVRLEQNYRSTKAILRLADSIIKQNKDQIEKTLWTENVDGEAVVLKEAISEKDEAQKTERTIRDIHVRRGYPFKDFAVLYRTNAQSRSLEDALRRGGIPYRIVGGQSFYQRREIKDALAYLRLIVNPSDLASLRRVINYPARGIGHKTQEVLSTFAVKEGLTLWQTLERIGDVGLSNRARTAAEKFRALIAKYVSKAGTLSADELAREIIREAGIFDDLRKDNTPENLVRWENVNELTNAIAEFVANSSEQATLSAFLQEVTLMTDADEGEDSDNKVTLMTLHASKGLEFPAVFITGLEEGLFPLSQAASDRKELEEERRLFYVGATRAEKHLFLMYARSRYRYGDQQTAVRSRFLEEIDASVIRTERGDNFEQRKDRFVTSQRGKGAFEGLDPHYYRKKPSGKSNGKGAVSSGRRIVYDEGEGGPLSPGMRVEHDLFGEGKVLALEGQGDRAKVTVFFKEVGQKKLVLKFAKLQRIG